VEQNLKIEILRYKFFKVYFGVF